MVFRGTSTIAPGLKSPGITFAAPPDGPLNPPEWVRELIDPATQEVVGGLCIVRSPQFMLISTAVRGADLQEITRSAYLAIARQLRGEPGWHAVRVWNFVPGILADGGDGLDRYMRFNAGRHAAYMQWLGGPGNFDRMLPTASAVGHSGQELIVLALAAREPGIAIANPRQFPPHRYSARFGPVPPCFARATLLPRAGGQRLLLVGGTASVRGELSMHRGDIAAQLDETFQNLAALVTAASESSPIKPLDFYRELRVYHVRDDDLPAIRQAVRTAFPRVRRVEWLRADLCRADLAVEIEGLAQLD